MSQLTHPLLVSLSRLVEKEKTLFKWIDLYAAQFIADLFIEQKACENSVRLTNEMGDLFDDLPEQPSCLNKADIIFLVLACSQLVSQGKTHLNLKHLPKELLNTVRACGYRPSFTSNSELLEGLYRLDSRQILRVVTCANTNLNDGIPLDADHLMKQSPLIMCQEKLYLAKYWNLHQAFESWLHTRSGYIERLDNELLTDLSKVLHRVFSKEDTQELDWQLVSAAHTLLNPFSLITGGPGTGKTTTAASLLFLLMEKRRRQVANQASLLKANGQALSNKEKLTEYLNVRLLAPTGKAAVKLADSIRHQLKQIESRILGHDLTRLRMSDCLPETGETVHRFLYEMGGLRDTFRRPTRFKGDEVLLKYSEQKQQDSVRNSSLANKPLDLVIVDESSMMDLALMVELVSLIPASTQLILLGDHHQLPAVDPGQVFTECVQRFSCYAHTSEELKALSILTTYSQNQLTKFEAPKEISGASHSMLHKSCLGFQPLCSLRKTFRFGGDLKIAADQIKAGEVSAFKQQFWCASDHYKTDSVVTWYDAELSDSPDYIQMVKAYERYFELVKKGASLTELAQQFERFQLLCSTLDGPLGVHFMNTYIEEYFYAACYPKGKMMGELYHGKAVLITRNHPHLGVYNGDIGFVIQDQRTNNLNVHFPVVNSDAIIIPPARIKEWQTAYAMTVHKSQGSEYEHVGVILADYTKDLLSRALLYTALTRSKKRCDIWVGAEALNKAFEDELLS